MLVLSRRVGEKLIIGGNVTVTIKQVRGKRVQVGIEAPSEVRIYRKELEPRLAQPSGGEGATELASESQN